MTEWQGSDLGLRRGRWLEGRLVEHLGASVEMAREGSGASVMHPFARSRCSGLVVLIVIPHLREVALEGGWRMMCGRLWRRRRSFPERLWTLAHEVCCGCGACGCGVTWW